MKWALWMSIIYCASALTLNLENDEEFFAARWIEPTTNPKLHVYIFNFTNSEEFLKGAKPKLNEVGPYVFSEDWEKTNIRWKDGKKRISYKQLRYFKFVPRDSVGRLRDKLTIPNIPMITALDTLKTAPPVAKRTIGTIFNILNQDKFETKTVRQILWGYSNPLLKLGRDIMKNGKAWPHDKFGILVGKNASADYTLDALTGIGNRADIGRTVAFNGKNKLPWWFGDKCNKIHGTDGFFFRPGLTTSSTVDVFHRDICRDMTLQFKSEVVDPHGIRAFRFTPKLENFASPKDNPDNACFCKDPNECGLTGTFDVGPCQFDSPLKLSNPHFLNADPSLLEAVDGLNPRPDKHEMFIDIEPTTGVGLGGKVQSQLNIQMSKITEDIKNVDGFRDILIPVVWLSDNIDKMNDEEMISRIKAKL